MRTWCHETLRSWGCFIAMRGTRDEKLSNVVINLLIRKEKRSSQTVTQIYYAIIQSASCLALLLSGSRWSHQGRWWPQHHPIDTEASVSSPSHSSTPDWWVSWLGPFPRHHPSASTRPRCSVESVFFNLFLKESFAEILIINFLIFLSALFIFSLLTYL